MPTFGFTAYDTSDDIEPDAAYAHAILKTLSQTLAVKVQRKDLDVVKYIDRLVPHIFNFFISSIFLSNERPVITTDPRLLQVAVEIITLVIQSLPLQLVKRQHVNRIISHIFFSFRRQESYSIGISKALIDGDVTGIAQGFQKIINQQKLSIFMVMLFSPLPGIFIIVSTEFKAQQHNHIVNCGDCVLVQRRSACVG
jgi:DNA repair/transcription protein MET18/MMS19